VPFACSSRRYVVDPETLYQRSSTDDELFPAVLTKKGIVPGVKPHLKVYALPGQDGATVGLCELNAPGFIA
jgi:hypothetical protein